jgi:hypothetical protein
MGERAVPDDVVDALSAREPIFHREPRAAGRSHFEALVTPDFWEVGASGRVYSRDFVLDTVVERSLEGRDDPWEVEGLAVAPIAPGVWLVTYELWQGPRRSRRATIWTETAEGWRACYHQGTLVQDG